MFNHIMYTPTAVNAAAGLASALVDGQRCPRDHAYTRAVHIDMTDNINRFHDCASGMMGLRLLVVLVEPMYDGNVGSVARAMKNFGFKDMVMINPCHIDDFGMAMAVHAKDILAGAKVAKNLSEAVEDADLVVGTTGKRLTNEQRHLRLHLRVPYLTPRDLGEKLKDKSCTIALLLGREDCGLTNVELEQCDLVVSIPTSEAYPVMNISHAATVLLYELSQVTGGRTEADLASGESMRRLRERIEIFLKEINYPEHKLDYVNLMLRRIFGRAELTEREVNTLMGILKNTLWKIKGGKEASGRGPAEVQEQV